ncbi:unnamed protein product, partial [marine sediment metagenome]
MSYQVKIDNIANKINLLYYILALLNYSLTLT